MSFDETYVGTRRQLRGVAESLIAGPQYRSSGTIRLAVRPDGFAAVTIPVAVHGTELVLPNDAVPLAGTVRSVAEAAGIESGPPEGVYEIADPLPPDAELTLDAEAAEWMYRSHYAGGHALEKLLPEQHPVLWPEHFDVAATEDEVNYGVSAGDGLHADAVRLRRPMDRAHRTVLERSVRRALSARPGRRCRRTRQSHRRLLRTRPQSTTDRQERAVTEFDGGTYGNIRSGCTRDVATTSRIRNIAE